MDNTWKEEVKNCTKTWIALGMFFGQQSFHPEVKKIEFLKSLQIPHKEKFLVLAEFYRKFIAKKI